MREILHFGFVSVLNDTLADTRYTMLFLRPFLPIFNVNANYLSPVFGSVSSSSRAYLQHWRTRALNEM